MSANQELRRVVTQYIGILNDQQSLTLPKVSQLIVSMFTDMETAVEERFVEIRASMDKIDAKATASENKLRGIQEETLGQVVRYVFGESLAKPGGLPADIMAMTESIQRIEKGLNNVTREIMNLATEVDSIKRSRQSGLPLRSWFFLIVILVGALLAAILIL